MKNKHLVLLFLGTLLLGLLLRQFPWQKNATPAVDLLRIDSVSVDRIRLQFPNQPALNLQKDAAGWRLVWDEFREEILPSEPVNAFLHGLIPLKSTPAGADIDWESAGLKADQAIQVFLRSSKREEGLLIGNSVVDAGQEYTYVALPGQQKIYRAPGRLLDLLTFKEQGRASADWCKFKPGAVRSIGTGLIGNPYRHWVFQDSTQRWVADTLQADSLAVAYWLQTLQQVKKAYPADFFDDSRVGQLPMSAIELELDSELLSLHFYYLRNPTVPEDLSRLQFKPLPQPCYIVQSSQQPNQWYALYDTSLVQRILNIFPHKKYKP